MSYMDTFLLPAWIHVVFRIALLCIGRGLLCMLLVFASGTRLVCDERVGGGQSLSSAQSTVRYWLPRLNLHANGSKPNGQRMNVVNYNSKISTIHTQRKRESILK